MNDDKEFDVIKDEEIIEKGKSAIAYLKPVIHIHGLDLPHEDTRRIERQIQEFLTDEVAKYDQAINGTEVTLRPIDKKEVIISLIGLDLPHEDTRRIERQIQEFLVEEVAKHGRSLQNVRVCSYEPPNLRVRTPFPIGVLAGIPTPPQGQREVYNYYFGEDSVAVAIFNAKDLNPNATSLHVYIQLSTPRDTGSGGPFSGWSKEIYGWNICSPTNPMFSLKVEGYNRRSAWREVGDAYVPGWSIVFRKPKEFGNWYNMYWLESSVFENTFGGKAVRFEWFHDRGPRP